MVSHPTPSGMLKEMVAYPQTKNPEQPNVTETFRHDYASDKPLRGFLTALPWCYDLTSEREMEATKRHLSPTWLLEIYLYDLDGWFS